MTETPEAIASRSAGLRKAAADLREVQERERRERGSSMRDRPDMRFLGAMDAREYYRLREQFGADWPRERARILKAFGVFGDLHVTEGK